jgi:membrane-bound metal-dependent hydrolase YbcI (DUF457 family)
MSPVTHGLLSWVIAQTPGITSRRDRALITVAGLLPDLDGIGIVVQWATAGSAQPLEWFSDYHHRLAHNLTAAVVCALALALFAQRKCLVAALGCLAFCLHLLGDVVGARGPDGHQWPMPLLAPFATWEWTWSGQWRLDSWQNLVITCVLLIITVVIACRRGWSPLEIVSPRADAVVVATLRRWFGPRSSQSGESG